MAKVAGVATALAMATSVLSLAPMAHAAGCDVGTTDLTIGSTGAGVICLQQTLVAGGHLTMPAGVAYGYFGALTKTAVAKWQTANGIMPAAGYFGSISRSKFVGATGGSASCPAGQFDPATGKPCGTTTTTEPGCMAGYAFSPITGKSCTGGTTPTTGGPLEGGAGSIDDYTIVGSLNNEEVGEGEEDVKVAGLEIEADEGSDVELTAIKLVFNEGTAASDFDEYASEVSVWFNDKEVARLDADEFNDDNDWTKTVSLDGGAIIRAGDTEALYVAVSANGTLDSDDESDTWTVDFTQVRFADADGAIITDTVTENAVTFSFESFASASDIELKVSEGDTEMNNARSISVDDSDDTDDVEILSFEIEAEGDSDLMIDDLSVDFTSVGAGVGEIINASALMINGESYSASTTIASTTATTMTVTYNDLDLTIDAGDTVEVVVTVDVNNLSGGFTAGDTLAADVNPDDAAWNVEDQEGDDLAAGDKSGTASNDAHSFYADGLSITDGASEPEPTINDSNGDTAGGQRGVYKVNFSVTAFGDDIYVPLGATISTSTVDTDDGIAYALENSDGTAQMLNAAGLASTTAAVTSSADTSGDYYVINEGTTETFTLTVTATPLADGYFAVQLYGVNFNVAAAAAADTLQVASPAADHQTDQIFLDV